MSNVELLFMCLLTFFMKLQVFRTLWSLNEVLEGLFQSFFYHTPLGKESKNLYLVDGLKQRGDNEMGT